MLSKTFKRFTCTNTTPINNILSHVHIQIQNFGVVQMLLLNTVGLSNESLIEDSFVIHFPTSHASTYPSKFILQSKLCYALPLNQGAYFYPGSLLISGRYFLLRIPLNPGISNYLFNIGEYFVASNHFIIVVIIHIMLITSTNIFTILKIVCLHNIDCKYNQFYRSMKLVI